MFTEEWGDQCGWSRRGGGKDWPYSELYEMSLEHFGAVEWSDLSFSRIILAPLIENWLFSFQFRIRCTIDAYQNFSDFSDLEKCIWFQWPHLEERYWYSGIYLEEVDQDSCYQSKVQVPDALKGQNLKMSEFGIRKCLLIKKAPTEKMGDNMASNPPCSLD